MGFFDSWNFTLRGEFQSQWLYPGNVLRGCLHITVSQPTKVRAVRMHIRGTESYSFRHGSGDRERTISASHRILDFVMTVAGFLPGQSGDFMMPAGTFSYPFQFTLPPNLPPSYEYIYGSDRAAMRYGVTGYVDIPWGKDAELEFPFQVLSCCPLSQWQASTPIEIPQNINVTLCCCIDKGSLSIKSRIARTLLVMGSDPAYIRVEIQSHCQEPINAVDLKLVQKNTTSDPCATDVNTRTTMKHKQLTNIQPNTNAVVDLCFTIPRGILPSFTGLSVKSEYFLKLEFDIPNASDPEVMFPVTVVQAVDPSNYFPPVNFQMPMCQMMAQPMSYAYQPPPQNFGYSYTPMAGAPPAQGGPVYQAPPPPVGVPQPDKAWSAMTPNQYLAEVPYAASAPPAIGVPPHPQQGMGQPGYVPPTPAYQTPPPAQKPPVALF